MAPFRIDHKDLPMQVQQRVQAVIMLEIHRVLLSEKDNPVDCDEARQRRALGAQAGPVHPTAFGMGKAASGDAALFGFGDSAGRRGGQTPALSSSPISSGMAAL
jgi:hypothetical protein